MKAPHAESTAAVKSRDLGRVVLCAALVLVAGPAPNAQRATADTVLAIEAWVHAVEEHQPGIPDAAVAAMQGWSPDRKRLHLSLELFERVLMEKGSTTLTPSTAERRLEALARDLAMRVGGIPFLERAAVLHSDAAMFRRLASVQQPSANDSKVFVLADDSAVVGSIQEDWNWLFARDLLDQIPLQPDPGPFISDWYHATAAYFLQAGRYVEARPHLDHAVARLPHDARLLFDRACLSESLGLPFSQQMLTAGDLLAKRFANLRVPPVGGPEGSIGGGLTTLPVGTRTSAFVTTPLEAEANADAERWLRRAIEADPTHAEARARLGRLLEVRKRDAEANAELSKALHQPAEPAVAFYAHLFSARANRNLGDSDSAFAQLRAALALFPTAQSALLAQSELAMAGLDTEGALSPLRALAAPARSGDDVDPWWLYHLGSGRDAETLLRNLWVKTPR